MTIHEFGTSVATIWEGLRPVTKKMLVGALQSSSSAGANSKSSKFSYDAHADWEVSRLLSALDEQSRRSEVRRDSAKLHEITQLADTCVRVLESQSASAEVFIQLTERALDKKDYRKIDQLTDILLRRFSVGEMCEIVRQTDNPAIRALGYETLAMMPIPRLLPLLEDPIYEEIVRNVLEQQAFEYENDQARQVLEQLDYDDEITGE